MLTTKPDLELTPLSIEDLELAYSIFGLHEPSVLTTVAEFAHLRAEWEHLHDASDAGVFLSWAWLYPWYQRIGHKRKLHIVTVRNGLGALAGLLPLSIEKRPLLGTRLGPSVRRMSFLGETLVGSDYLDVIAHHDDREGITRRLLEAVRDRGAWDVLDLNDMDSRSPTLPIIQDVFGHTGYTLEWRNGPVCPYEEFQACDTFEAFTKNLGRGDTYKRRRKWLEKQEGYRILRATCPHEMELPLAEFFRLHALRWRDDGGSDGITCPEVEIFHRDATSYLAERGNICLYTMMVGDRAVASFYALMHKGKMICYLTGRDPEWQSRSVGTVLVGETFHDALDMGMREYDFLRGEEAYKADWSSQQRSLVSVRIYRPGSTGAWLSKQEDALGSARRIARKVLPADLIQRLRSRC
jgi:CelD/BcsL family acetyltransferase involved in cellulose biosynthesis